MSDAARDTYLKPVPVQSDAESDPTRGVSDDASGTSHRVTEPTPLPAPKQVVDAQGAQSPPDGAEAAALDPIPAIPPETLAMYEQVVSRVLFAETGDGFLLAVTSAVRGEGVTTTASSVAIALAQSTTKPVLLVDANLRDPSVFRLFRAANEPGLSDFIFGVEQARMPHPNSPHLEQTGILATTIPNLWILPAGRQLNHPTPLLTSDAARRSMDLLKTLVRLRGR